MTAFKLVPALSILALVAAGCSTPQSQIQLSSQKSGELFQQSLPMGIADVQDAGDTDIVVACDIPGTTSACPPVRQVMHVRVLWQAGHVVKAHNEQISQNAAFHWYITPAAVGDSTASPVQPHNAVVEYHGTGLVKLDQSGDQVVMTIVQAKMTPSHVSGDMMIDRLGPTKLTGTIKARVDRNDTAIALADLRATLADARNGATAEAKLPMGQ
jgi:hypothetical protein